MGPPRSDHSWDAAVVGAGLSGMSAAMFAANRGLSTIHIGGIGELQMSSGLMDLMQKPSPWRESPPTGRSPWRALDRLATDAPDHPLAKLRPPSIRSAINEVFDFLKNNGLPYQCRPDDNVAVPTFGGTLKPTYGVPLTMWAGVEAFEAGRPSCIVGIEGLKGFSPRLIVESLKDRWPKLRGAAVRFPGTRGEVFPTHLSRLLEEENRRRSFAGAIRPLLEGARAVGIPAIIGLSGGTGILSDLTDAIGVPVFEVPTLPPSMAGIRLCQAFEKGLAGLGVHALHGRRVHRISRADGRWELTLEEGMQCGPIRSRCIILATGRFFGGGLTADRRRIRESILDLPVVQPGRREHWHSPDFFAPAGHPVNRAGLDIDRAFRPIDRTGRFAAPSLFAAGSILARQDWKRGKYGSGLSIATAYGAVAGALEYLELPQSRSIHP
ncbi:MAG: glycerol-3-phosphate dehydrogenase subunit GlpB [Desulfobacterales bacterium]